MNLDSARVENFFLPVPGDINFASGCECPDQIEHNGFEVWEGRSAELSVLVSVSETE